MWKKCQLLFVALAGKLTMQAWLLCCEMWNIVTKPICDREVRPHLHRFQNPIYWEAQIDSSWRGCQNPYRKVLTPPSRCFVQCWRQDNNTVNSEKQMRVCNITNSSSSCIRYGLVRRPPVTEAAFTVRVCKVRDIVDRYSSVVHVRSVTNIPLLCIRRFV